MENVFSWPYAIIFKNYFYFEVILKVFDQPELIKIQ